jgi:hypothetical protein
MYKIFLTCRNRLSMTKKAITALEKHSRYPHQIYVYDNLTSYLLMEHFVYWGLLFEKNIISQVTFTSAESTFNAFSKAATNNFFALQHEQDPNKDTYDFLLIMDNDIIVDPDWDDKVMRAWKDIRKRGLSHIKIVTQFGNGMMDSTPLSGGICGKDANVGSKGGSAFWSVRPNFFTEVGMLNLTSLVNLSKKHDQQYWKKLEKIVIGKPYIVGLKENLFTHCGGIAGSICNRLSKNNTLNPEEKIKLISFEDQERDIDSMEFDEFYERIKKTEIGVKRG